MGGSRGSGSEGLTVAKVWESQTEDGMFRLHWWLAETEEGEIVMQEGEVSDVRWVTAWEFARSRPAAPGSTPPGSGEGHGSGGRACRWSVSAPGVKGCTVIPRRGAIKSSIGCLMHHRGLAGDYETHPHRSEAIPVRRSASSRVRSRGDDTWRPCVGGN
ncbi:hypothetical protein QFZ22_009637 [Streptomyces canus]|uniref:Nudix hydrolase domain-containing protein n=1 Tax=Streptomyces canus TaxID=58343 RepID=A0AAW8FVI1_9ACTN|nr:hypothetical protein [Streptomyces canus]